MIDFVRERKFTENLNPKQVITKNNRSMIKATCTSCGIIKTMFISTKQTAGAIDIHKAMLRLLLKKDVTLLGYKYCSPGNPLDSEQPVNELDALCMTHDYCYNMGTS